MVAIPRFTMVADAELGLVVQRVIDGAAVDEMWTDLESGLDVGDELFTYCGPWTPLAQLRYPPGWSPES